MWLRGKQHTSRSIITVPTMHGSGHAVAQHHRSKHCVTHFLGSLARPRAATRVRLAPAMVPLRHDITHQAIVSFPHLGFLPRLAPPCFPGNQSGSLSTSLKNMHSALGVGLPPPTFSTRSAIQASCARPLCSSRLASRRPSARACCHADMRPSGAECHASRRMAWVIAGDDASAQRVE